MARVRAPAVPGLAGLTRAVEHAWGSGAHRLALVRGVDGLTIGLEERTARDRYDWHGQRRGADPRHPFAVIQYTLSGWGRYEDRHGRQVVGPGHLFVALAPADNRYWLPAESARWRFLYAIIDHPFALELLRRGVEAHGGAVPAPPGSPLATALVRLFCGVRLGSFDHRLAIEQAAVDLAFAHARRLHELHPSGGERERRLAEVRAYLDAHPGRYIDVAELAQAAGTSRSAFSHAFTASTGTTPAAYLIQVRLEAVRRQLLESDAPLQALAEATGFANANHLCKVFRRHLHASPGEWRKRMGGR